MVQAAAAHRWGLCSWCGWRDCALVEDGPPELWACDAHWPDGGPRPSLAPAPSPAGPAAASAAPPSLDRGAARMYWERAEDDPAPTVAELQASRAAAAAEHRERAAGAARAEAEQATRELAAHRAVEAARAGGRWLPLGFLHRERRR
jgi:hypothetical protein